MHGTLEVPFPAKPRPEPPGYLEPPRVPFEPRWEYHEVIRSSEAEPLIGQDELNRLGDEHWELVGVVTAAGRVHFYFKRARYP